MSSSDIELVACFLGELGAAGIGMGYWRRIMNDSIIVIRKNNS